MLKRFFRGIGRGIGRVVKTVAIGAAVVKTGGAAAALLTGGLKSALGALAKRVSPAALKRMARNPPLGRFSFNPQLGPVKLRLDANTLKALQNGKLNFNKIVNLNKTIQEYNRNLEMLQLIQRSTARRV